MASGMHSQNGGGGGELEIESQSVIFTFHRALKLWKCKLLVFKGTLGLHTCATIIFVHNSVGQPPPPPPGASLSWQKCKLGLNVQTCTNLHILRTIVILATFWEYACFGTIHLPATCTCRTAEFWPLSWLEEIPVLKIILASFKFMKPDTTCM